MEAIDKEGRSLEEVVEALLSDDEEFKGLDPQVVIQAKIQRLRGELRRYSSRPRIYAQQIAYLRRHITELESKL
jgi:hypothetical protein